MKKHSKLLLGALVVVLAMAVVPAAAFAQSGSEAPPSPAQALLKALTDTAAQTLNMSPESFIQAMRSGQTPAELAQEAGVSTEELAAAMQETWNAQGEVFIGKFIENGLPPKYGRRHHFRTIRRWTKTAAETLEMPTRAFVKELRSGQTPAQIAEAHGSSGQAVTEAIVAAEKARLDKAVAEGKLTQEKADEILARVTEAAVQWVENGRPKPPRGH